MRPLLTFLRHRAANEARFPMTISDPVERWRLMAVVIRGGSGVKVAGQMSDLMEGTNCPRGNRKLAGRFQSPSIRPSVAGGKQRDK